MSVAIGAVKDVRARLDRSLSGSAQFRFTKATISLPNLEEKPALVLDILAERECGDYFAQRFRNDVHVIGEEFLPEHIEQNGGPRVWALVDMIDGTDLLEMDIPLWCSAIVLFDVLDVKILGAVIALASGEIYFASEGENAAFVHRDPNDPDLAHFVELVHGPSDVRALKDARVCFYGQRASRMSGLFQGRKFMEKVKTLGEADFRIYNFAGNPIMVRLVDRLRDSGGHLVGRGFDAVFDVSGQQLHDLVPGAYIAKRAGACLLDLDGNEITEDMLAQKLLSPKSRISYVLAGTRELATELVESLQML